MDQLAELSKTVVTRAVETVVEPIAEEGLKQGIKLASGGVRIAGQGVRMAGEGVRMAGEGVKLAGEGVKIAEGMLRKVLRQRREEREKKDEGKKG